MITLSDFFKEKSGSGDLSAEFIPGGVVARFLCRSALISEIEEVLGSRAFKTASECILPQWTAAGWRKGGGRGVGERRGLGKVGEEEEARGRGGASKVGLVTSGGSIGGAVT